MYRQVFVAICVLTAPALAETTWTDKQEDNLTIVRITATPAAAPAPLLKYRFSLPPSRRTPGNAAADYRRAFAENGSGRKWEYLRQTFPSESDQGGKLGVDDWYDTDVPLHELPADDVAIASSYFNGVIDNFVRPGTSRRRCEWDLPTLDLSGLELISMLLPEFQELRSLSRATSLQTRHALIERRFDDAIDLIRMNYTMGRDAGREPLLICDLVGIAICNITNNQVQDLIGVPDSPNLYWALTTLPQPLVPIREAIEVEMELGSRMLPLLRSPDRETLSYDEWNARWKHWARYTDENQFFTPQTELPAASGILPVAFGLMGYTHAKQRLVAWGYNADEVEAMPVGQVLSLYSSRAYQQLSDRFEVAHALPFREASQWYEQAEDKLRAAGPLSAGLDREIIPIASLLLPAVGAARGAEMRLDRDIAALRVIEALRMHAAENKGELPAKLADVTCVPIPRNPATDEPFAYELKQVDGRPTAVLTLPRSDGIVQTYRYELVIKSRE